MRRKVALTTTRQRTTIAEMLDVLDIDPVDQQVYESLLDRHPQAVEDLREGLGLDTGQVERAVRSLLALGLISQLPGPERQYRATSPETALEVLLLERERRLQQARAYAEKLTARFQQSADPNAAELIEVISGVPAIRQRWEQLQRSVRHELRGIDKPPYTVREMPDMPPIEAELLGRGIRYRIIYDTAGLETFHRWEADIEMGIALGEEARAMTGAPTKLVLFDDRLGLLPLQPAPAAIASMIVVHPSGLLEALFALFEDLWRRALPLTSPDDTATATEDRPTVDEQRLLRLLATGMPDNAIARHLGLSHRTLQRRLRGLFDRLGAGNRFQAALQAGRRGWIR